MTVCECQNRKASDSVYVRGLWYPNVLLAFQGLFVEEVEDVALGEELGRTTAFCPTTTALV